jgi:hypothetical protein
VPQACNQNVPKGKAFAFQRVPKPFAFGITFFRNRRPASPDSGVYPSLETSAAAESSDSRSRTNSGKWLACAGPYTGGDNPDKVRGPGAIGGPGKSLGWPKKDPKGPEEGKKRYKMKIKKGRK